MSKQAINSANTSQSISGELLYMLKAVSAAYIISVILLFPAVLLAVFKAYSDTGISILVNIITAFGTAFSGFLSGRHSSGKGIFFGAGSGILYTILLCIAGNLIAQNMSIGSEFLTALLIGTICGGIGGIAGINSKPKRRK